MKLCSLILLLLIAACASAQYYKIKGTVYDSSRSYPMQAVSVISSSGKFAITNAEGFYEIEVSDKDSIWFSYLNKPTVKFPVGKINNPFGFDIALHVNVPVLKEVRIRQRNYRQDSLQNRSDYSKIFNYQKPGLKTVTPEYGAAVGFDLEEIINIFRFRRNRNIASFQRRLLQQEQDKFVDHRFNKALVRRLTMLTDTALDSFMMLYRPSYEFALTVSDYEFQEYIRTAFFRFRRGMPSTGIKEEGD